MNLATLSPIIKDIALFGGLMDDQLEILVGMLELNSFQKQKVIFKHGGEPCNIYIILSGKVKILCEHEGQKPLEIIEFGIGDCFGETSVIGILPHSGSAIAMVDTELIVLSRKALMEIYEKDARLFGILILNIAREACRRLYHTNQTVFHYAQKNKETNFGLSSPS